MSVQQDTRPTEQMAGCDTVRALGQRGCPWADAAEQVGVAALTAETYVTLHHLRLRLTCEWLGQGLPIDVLRQQEAELEARWFTLNPGETPALLPRLKALYEAWRMGHTLHAMDTLEAVRQQAQTKPSGAVLTLWCRLVRQAQEPTFTTALRGLSRSRRTSLPATWLGTPTVPAAKAAPPPVPTKRKASQPLAPGFSRIAQADLHSRQAAVGERFEVMMGIQKPQRA